MSLTHIHLILNHVPMIGLGFVVLCLAAAIRLRSKDLSRFALGCCVLVGLVAVPVFLTGEPAEDNVENLAGVSKAAIETHEDAAEVALWAVEVLAVIALVSLIIYRGPRDLPRRLILTSFVLCLIGGGIMAYTANLGGRIRHSEIRPDSVSAAPATGNTHADRQNRPKDSRFDD